MHAPKTLALIALAVGVASCTKTVEEESQRWAQASAKVDELKVLYPAFAPALGAQRDAAKAAMTRAEAVKGEERAEQMAEANRMLTAGFVGELAAVDGAKKRLRRKMSDASRATGGRQAADNAKKVIAEVDRRLKEGAKDPASAQIVLSKITGDLRAAERDLDRVKRRDRKDRRGDRAGAGGSFDRRTKKAANLQGGGSTAKPAGKAAPKKDEKAATWVCQYCGRTNHGGDLSCEGCGAAMPAKKK